MNDLLKPKAVFIGIDQAYTGFGLVVLDDEGICLRKNLWKFPKTEDDGERLATINDKLWARLGEYSLIDTEVHIAMEGYSYGSQLNREKLGELGGLVKMVSFLLFGKSPTVFAPTTLKQSITGKGNASKEDMVVAIQRIDPEVTNHNVADAYGLAYMLYCAN